MSFPKGSPPTTQLVHPTQIYESLMSLAILAVLLLLLRPRLVRAGSLFWAYLALGGVERFVVEFARTNQPVALGLTQAQWISVALFAGGIAIAWWLESHRATGFPAGGVTSAGARSGAGVGPGHRGAGRSSQSGKSPRTPKKHSSRRRRDRRPRR